MKADHENMERHSKDLGKLGSHGAAAILDAMKIRGESQMIKRYRKKPVVISAAQYVGGEDNIAEILKFGEGKITYLTANKTLKIDTLEGTMEASVGDFIIQGVHGEFYPCKPEIFVKTYEFVPEFSIPGEHNVKRFERNQVPYNPNRDKLDIAYAINTGPDIL